MNTKLDNVVIECLDREQSEKLKEFWLRNGYGEYYGFSLTKSYGHTDRFYGLIDGDFNNYDINEIKDYVKVLTIEQAENLIKEPISEYPKKMWVWDNHENNKMLTTVIGKIEIGNPVYPYIIPDNEINFLKGEKYRPVCYMNAKPYEPIEWSNETVKQCIKDLTGIDVELIKIERYKNN